MLLTSRVSKWLPRARQHLLSTTVLLPPARLPAAAAAAPTALLKHETRALFSAYLVVEVGLEGFRELRGVDLRYARQEGGAVSYTRPGSVARVRARVA